MSDIGEQDVTLYSKPGCVQCTATERQFDRDGIEFTKVDVTQDPAALEHVKDLGYSAAPVVEVTSAEPEQAGHWSGFRPDMIATIGTDHVATEKPPPADLHDRLDQLLERTGTVERDPASRSDTARYHLDTAAADLSAAAPGLAR